MLQVFLKLLNILTQILNSINYKYYKNGFLKINNFLQKLDKFKNLQNGTFKFI
jgi:hypothetical protein